MNAGLSHGRLTPRGARGQAAAEFALVISLFLMIVFGVFDLGRAIQVYNQVALAARQGAEVAKVGGDDAAVKATAAGVKGLAPLVARTVAVQRWDVWGNQLTPGAPPAPGQTVRVRVQYNLTIVTPLVSMAWGGGPATLVGTAETTVE